MIERIFLVTLSLLPACLVAAAEREMPRLASGQFGNALVAADLRLDLSGARANQAAVPSVQPSEKRHVAVFNEPRRYGGWPANGGVWSWGT